MHLVTEEASEVKTDAPEAKNIDVQILSMSAWRIRDKRFPEHDARALIGFIEKKADLFEVMQLGQGFQWFSYPTLAEAIAHFARVSPPASPTDHVMSWRPSHV